MTNGVDIPDEALDNVEKWRMAFRRGDLKTQRDVLEELQTQLDILDPFEVLAADLLKSTDKEPMTASKAMQDALLQAVVDGWRPESKFYESGKVFRIGFDGPDKREVFGEDSSRLRALELALAQAGYRF